MKELIRKSKRKGFSGRKSKWNLGLFLGVMAFFALLSAVCFLMGGISGFGMGAVFATVPVLGFSMPEGIELTENEKKGLSAIADHFNKQFSEYVKNNLSAEKMMESMKEKLEAFGKESGFDKDKLEKMFNTLKQQGESLSTLKQDLNREKQSTGGLKAKFFEKFDELAKAVKEEKENYRLKANPDTIDQTLIETTGVITTSTGANLYEQTGQSNELFLKRRDRQYIDEIADTTVVASVPETFTFYEEGDEEGNVAIVAENGLKPQVQLKLIKNKVDARKAAGTIVVTEELMKWRTRAWAAIQRLFRDKVMRDYENQLTASLLPNATQYIGTALDGTVANPNSIDSIIAGVAQLESLNFSPDILILNPTDKWGISLLKDSSGAYLFPLISQDGTVRIASLRIITSNKIEAGKFLLGESGLWKIEREEPQLRTGLVNDDLIHNRVTIVGEIFFLSYVPSNNAGGFLLGDFAQIKEALAAA